jgi:hypothetical protein
MDLEEVMHVPTLEDIETMPVDAVAALSAEALAILTKDLVTVADRSRKLREKLIAALALRYDDTRQDPVS